MGGSFGGARIPTACGQVGTAETKARLPKRLPGVPPVPADGVRVRERARLVRSAGGMLPTGTCLAAYSLLIYVPPGSCLAGRDSRIRPGIGAEQSGDRTSMKLCGSVAPAVFLIANSVGAHNTAQAKRYLCPKTVLPQRSEQLLRLTRSLAVSSSSARRRKVLSHRTPDIGLLLGVGDCNALCWLSPTTGG